MPHPPCSGSRSPSPAPDRFAPSPASYDSGAATRFSSDHLCPTSTYYPPTLLMNPQPMHATQPFTSYRSSPVHSPRHSRSPSPAPGHPSPSPGHHTARNYPSSASIDHHPSTYSVTGYPPVNNYLSPPSTAYYPPPHPTTNPGTGYPPAPPFLYSNPTTQPSSSFHQLEYSMYEASPFTYQPTHIAPLPFPHNPYHRLNPTTNDLYPDPTLSHPLPAPQPSITIHRPGESTHGNFSAHRQLRQGQASTFQRQRNQGMFSGSHNLSFSDNTFIDNSTTSDTFMEKLLKHTIIGAEFDSSDRHPPPRCHPGTRLAIVERCRVFVLQCDGQQKMRWVVGPAGAGKSAIMQIVAEETPADASIFFSVNGRKDGTKTFTTIAYQLAAKCEPYRQFIRNEIKDDPSLFRKALPVQFHKFIVDPFIHQQLFDPSRRFLIIIDGLDECDNPLTQRELLGLISDFCISYSTSPIVWIVASRPEPHITSFFDNTRVAPVFTMEEISIDSDEACGDVQLYLRDELHVIKLTYPTLEHKREWPSELEFTKLATASGGLFAYASTAVRYIGDPYYRDPVAQLHRVLEVIDADPKGDLLGMDHPMAQLDALYKRIFSTIPADVLINARKLLFVYSGYGRRDTNFRSECNRLGLTEDAAYGAVRHLHAVVKVPAPHEADVESLEYFHKSFPDFLSDSKRSEIFHNVEDEGDQLLVQSSLKIVNQVPDNFDGIASGRGIRCYGYGYLKAAPGICDNISLSWPGDGRSVISDEELRLRLYRNAMSVMCDMFIGYTEFYENISWFHILTSRFSELDFEFPVYDLRDAAFEHFRPELLRLSKLKQVPLRAFDYATIRGRIDLQFSSPVGTDVQISDPWNASCQHEKEDVESLREQHIWSTSFERFPDVPGDNVTHTVITRFHIENGVSNSPGEFTSSKGYYDCISCLRRFASQFADNRDDLVDVFVDSAEMCYVEWLFVDPEDGVSEWRYRFCHSGLPSCSGVN